MSIGTIAHTDVRCIFFHPQASFCVDNQPNFSVSLTLGIFFTSTSSLLSVPPLSLSTISRNGFRR